MWGHAEAAIEVGRRSGYDFYMTCVLLEAGRCAFAQARHDAASRPAMIDRAEALFGEVDERAEYAGYRLIEADAHVARAELAQLAGDEDTMRRHRAEAIAICRNPDCAYAWAKQAALALR